MHESKTGINRESHIFSQFTRTGQILDFGPLVSLRLDYLLHCMHFYALNANPSKISTERKSRKKERKKIEKRSSATYAVHAEFHIPNLNDNGGKGMKEIKERRAVRNAAQNM